MKLDIREEPKVKIPVEICEEIPEYIRNEITELYQSTMNKSIIFVEEIYNRGYRLAKHLDTYVIIDEDEIDRVYYELSKAAGVSDFLLQETLKSYPLQDLQTIEQVFVEDIELDEQISLRLKHLSMIH